MANLLRTLATLAVAVSTAAAQERYDLRLTVDATPVAAPTVALTSPPEFVRGSDGLLAALWTQTAPDGGTAVEVARFDAVAKRWSEPSVVTGIRRQAVPSPGVDACLAMGENARLAVAWTELRDGAPRAMISFSDDAGGAWTPSEPLAPGGGATVLPALAARPEGGWSAAWIELAGKDGADRRLWFAERWGASAKPVLLAEPVSLSRPALRDFPDGSSDVMFRDQSDAGTRDPWSVRIEEDGGRSAVQVGREGWRAPATSVPEVRISASGPLVGAAWFTAADGEARILSAMTPDGGLRWTTALRCDLGRGVGPADIAILKDGTELVLWAEGPGDDPSLPGGYYLRRYAPNGGSAMPARLAGLPAKSPVGAVRLAVLRDHQGERTELLAAWVTAGSGGGTGLHCEILRLPDAAQLEELDRTCHCGPGSLPGYPVRGRILTLDAAHAALSIHHSPVPGLFRAGDLSVKADPALLKTLAPGKEFLGRIEKRDGAWWLSDVRLFE